MPARILIIGLDGADPALLTRWCGDGSLPAIQALFARGCSGGLSTPEGLGDDAAWPSFYTGQPVGTHGRYFYEQLTGGGARLVPSRDRLPVIKPFWMRREANERIAVIDVPKVPLSQPISGFHLCDWLVHGRDYHEATSYPAEIAPRILAEFGAAPPSICDEVAPDLEEATVRTMSERLCRSAGMKSRAVRHFLADGHWDLMVVGFKEAHCVSHMLWHLVDPSHPDYRAGAEVRLGEPMMAVYRALDCAIAEVIDAAGPEASILVFTPLGMATNITGNYLMPSLAEAINRRHRASLGVFDRTAAAILRVLRPGGRPRRWRQTHRLCRALTHNEISGALRLNVIGRDPGGMVEAGAPYDALCRQLAAELAELRDVETGRKVVADVLLSKQTFAGPANGPFPDLFIVWDRSASIGDVTSPQLGVISAVPEAHSRSGNHVPGGLYIVAGPAGKRWQSGDIDICDLARVFLEAAA
jgi:predicted AlkP superfamily phosphohydrolase/phosphomutase